MPVEEQREASAVLLRDSDDVYISVGRDPDSLGFCALTWSKLEVVNRSPHGTREGARQRLRVNRVVIGGQRHVKQRPQEGSREKPFLQARFERVMIESHQSLPSDIGWSKKSSLEYYLAFDL